MLAVHAVVVAYNGIVGRQQPRGFFSPARYYGRDMAVCLDGASFGTHHRLEEIEPRCSHYGAMHMRHMRWLFHTAATALAFGLTHVAGRAGLSRKLNEAVRPAKKSFSVKKLVTNHLRRIEIAPES